MVLLPAAGLGQTLLLLLRLVLPLRYSQACFPQHSVVPPFVYCGHRSLCCQQSLTRQNLALKHLPVLQVFCHCSTCLEKWVFLAEVPVLPHQWLVLEALLCA